MTETESTLPDAEALLRPMGGPMTTPEPNRLDVSVPASQLVAAANCLVAAHWGHLAAITGLDGGAESGMFEVLYHFCAGPAVVTLRTLLPRAAPVVPSLTGLITCAGLYERELSEMLGISIAGSSNTDPLYLPDDWPAEVYPLRKDAQLPGEISGTGAS